MKVGLGADHRGYKKKEIIKKYLEKKKIEYTDYGTDSEESVDYNDYAVKVCNSVLNKEVDCGILICGTGIGMSIMANKIKGIMCAKVSNPLEAKLAREHNNANVISISARNYNYSIKDMVDSYLNSNYLDIEKYNNRIEKIKKAEKE